MRKFIIIISLFIIVAGAITWYFLFYQTTVVTFSNNSTFKAVPIHSPVIIELPNAENVMKVFSEDNAILAELKNAGLLSSLDENITFLKDIENKNLDFKKLLAEKSALIALNFEGKNGIDYIFLVSMKDKKEQSQALDLIKQNTKASTLSKKNYDNVEIYRTTINNIPFSFAFTNGILVASRESILVEEAIRQSNAECLTDIPDFVKLNKTSNPNALANIYINHKTIGQFLSKSLNSDVRKKIGYLQNFAERTELDLNLKKNEIFLNGYTFSNDSDETYANLFRNQAPIKSDIESVLPSNTSMFLSLSIEKPDEFFDDYEEYSRIARTYYQRATRLEQIQRETKTDFLKEIKELTTGISGIAFTTITQNEPENNRFFLMELKSQSTAREKMELLLNKYIDKKQIDPQTLYSKYTIDEKRIFNIYQFPFSDISEILFGKIYSGVACNFFTFYDNYIIFSDSQAALKEYIHNLVLGENLSKDADYTRFKAGISNKSNLYLYLNFSRAFHLSKLFLNDEKLEKWIKNEETIRKFYGFSWQFSNTKGLILNNIYINFNPDIKEEPQTVWQTKLESNILTCPKMVINHNDRDNKEVILQDQENNLYLINKEGVTLWKIKLPEPIISDIIQIDIYRNNKYQYLFNTKSQIYLIDRNGEKVKGYPVTLRSPATNGIAVIDYKKDKDYRFFIAGADKRIYAYTKDGKFLKGWSNFTTDNIVEKPIQHMIANNKDYIVLFDRYKTYFLDRKGNVRLTSKASFEHSDNELIFDESSKPSVLCTDTKGTVYKLFFDGNFEKMEMESLSANHFFTSGDINGNGHNDYIFADRNQLFVYSDAGKKIFVHDFKKPISEKPQVFSFNNSKKIGIVSSEENRIYLLNANGSIYDGFPLQGNSDFCIGILSKGNKFFNLMVGNEDNSLFNYMVE